MPNHRQYVHRYLPPALRPFLFGVSLFDCGLPLVRQDTSTATTVLFADRLFEDVFSDYKISLADRSVMAAMKSSDKCAA